MPQHPQPYFNAMRQDAVRRAREAALPGYAQEWISDYFSALTGADNQ